MSSFSQKILVTVAAVAFVWAGLWYLQRGWTSEDPETIEVSPEVESRIWKLLERSKTAGYQERIGIFYEIRGIGRQNVPVLVEALQHEDARIRAFAANLLQYSENPRVIPHLEPMLGDEEPIVRRAALVALGYLGAIETVPAIILVLDDEDNFTRCQAALVLGTLGRDGAVMPLIEILEKDSYPVARRTAANSLGEIGNEKAVPPLIDSLEDRDYQVRSASLVALNRITGESLGPNKDDWADWWSEKEAAAVRE